MALSKGNSRRNSKGNSKRGTTEKQKKTSNAENAAILQIANAVIGMCNEIRQTVLGFITAQMRPTREARLLPAIAKILPIRAHSIFLNLNEVSEKSHVHGT